MVKNAEEEEHSDGDSLEEITAEEFRHDPRRSRSPRVRIPHMLVYPITNNPLGFELMPVAVDDKSEEVGFELEKEEVELEEGEIKLDSEMVDVELVDPSNNSAKETVDEEPKEMDDIDRRVGIILGELETVTTEVAESSFDVVCSRLQKSFESLKEIFLEGQVPVIDFLIHQAFMGIQTIHLVIRSGNLKDKERNVDLLLRLLVHLKNQCSILLTPEQINEIDDLVKSLVSDNKNKDVKHGSGVSKNGFSNCRISLEKPSFDTMASNNVISNNGKTIFANLETPFFAKKRVEFSPLLDPHADYDEKSLPSPTRESEPPLLLYKPDPPMPLKMKGSEDDKLHLYDIDAVKAVSSYQQKYRQTSLLFSDRLPSPTPSDNGDNNDDTHGEVSSSNTGAISRTVNCGRSSLQLLSFSSGSGETTEGTNAPTMKSRDLRLRMLNSNNRSTTVDTNTPNGLAAMNSRKNKALGAPASDDLISKRQRNWVSDSRDAQTIGRGGWLEDASDDASLLGNRKSEKSPDKKPKVINENFNGTNGGILKPEGGNTNLNGTNGGIIKPKGGNANFNGTTDYLVKLQSSTTQVQLKKPGSMQDAEIVSNNRLSTEVCSVNRTSVKTFGIVPNPAGPSQLPAQTAIGNPQTDVGQIHIKPRDPHHILHNNVLHKDDQSKFEPTKISRNPSSEIPSGHPSVRQQGRRTNTIIFPAPPTLQPDISRPFTKNLKDQADMISSSRLASTSSAAPQNTPQPTPVMTNTVDPKPAGACLNKENSTASSPSGVAPPPTNTWGDVDHLLDGYDEQEKATIQKERARRIEEQNKMFLDRKLCLVLDLDHTLLNSAKFLEVDPEHDDILRKKEEQDRENPQRHLFRFPHMGMWTKLRPGVWNFLERASKLFEMHLYTMGNKLYATEMAKVLDPKGTLFNGRVIARGDDGNVQDGDEMVPKIKDLDGVLGMESAVVIIDDTVRVWPHNKLNLIVVERYTYFPCSRRQFGLLGPSLLEIDHDERPENGSLSSSLAVIERIHHNFFSHRSLSEVDVRSILADEQRKILEGCTILFSRIFPVGDANAHMHPLWQIAKQFGAVCTNKINEQVTHVVANLLRTDKVNWALSTGRFVVTPGWVEASALLYRRVNEHDFQIIE